MRSFLAFTLLLSATLPGSPAAGGESFGILVMAHGGSPAWDATVREALAPLREEMPVELALGMADAVTLENAVRTLEERGVERIGVVRLFISGDSWYERVQQILGLEPGAPPRPHHDPEGVCAEDEAGSDGGGDAGCGEHSTAFYRVPSSARFAVSREGLNEAPEAGRILLERARDLSQEPAGEDVLVLAHGVGDLEGNAIWRARIEARTGPLREEIPFRRVQVETLAEDWPEARAAAEERIRAFVRRAAEEGGRAIVIPFRLSGFGPYAEVLEGLDYVSDGKGLLPHAAVTDWIRRQAEDLRDGPFRRPISEPDGS